MSQARPTSLPLIQVLRALAAVMVAAGHAQFEVAGLAARAGLPFAPAAWLPWPAGVDVFFVISGFIIVHAAAPLHGRPGAGRVFLAHRIARVVPLYWLATTLYLALAWLRPGLLGSGGEGTGYLAASYLFWPTARADGTVQPLYSLGWTLNYEMAFYVVFALVLPWGRRPAVAGVAAIFTGLALLGGLAARGGAALPVPLAFWSDPIVLEFACGAGLALARQEGLRLPALLRLALAGAGLALLSLAGEVPSLPRCLAWGGPAVLLVAAAALGPAGPGDPRRAHLLRPAILLGDASYALYLAHPFVVRGVRVVVEATGLAARLGPGPVAVAMLVLAGLVAIVLHRMIERPLTRAARALLEPKRAVNKV
ncbi:MULTISPECIES: acyltransferase family protein [Methylobacterium]|uniref:Predicted acyltransferases n=2 Tax=Methylobacterium TaxID=407 RepID=A0A0C6F910_9HYPH|nr:acyltransferase [Methylobacterium aquaticum]BAQ44903.1 predicted acyltransferases [Methylobacterium aquaticum]